MAVRGAMPLKTVAASRPASSGGAVIRLPGGLKRTRGGPAVDRADDQGHGGVDVGGLVDAAEPLLRAQVSGQDCS